MEDKNYIPLFITSAGREGIPTIHGQLLLLKCLAIWFKLLNLPQSQK